MKIGSLFSGVGGLDLGVQQALGGEVAWHCEVDPAASKVLAHHWPDVPNLGDITAVNWSQLEAVDVLTAGFPCQDVSHAGKRLGIRPGTRSGLWSQVAYAVSVLRPSLLIVENVRGLLSASAASDLEPCPWCVGDDADVHLRALGAVLGDLADLGYDAAWHGIRAADVGACHGRFRVFIVAYPQGDPGRLEHGEGGVVAHTAGPRRPGQQDSRANSGDAGTRARGVEPQRDSYAPAADPDVPTDHGQRTRAQSWSRVEIPGALFRTPTAQLAVNGGSQHPDKRKAGGHGPTLADEVEHLLPTPMSRDGKGRNQRDDDTCLTGALLPTPRVTDGTKGGPQQRGTSGDLMLPSAVTLLPTPAVNDMGAGKTVEQWDDWTAAMRARHGNGNGHGPSLAIEAQRTTQDWGVYADAIRRHEQALGRPAPSPTQLSESYRRMVAKRLAGLDKRPVGMRGSLRPQPQLSPRFVEWMMMLPDGHITAVPGLTRNQALKILGNGVVPAQATVALSWLAHTLNRAEDGAA